MLLRRTLDPPNSPPRVAGLPSRVAGLPPVAALAALLCASWPAALLAAPPATKAAPAAPEPAVSGFQAWLNSILSPDMQAKALPLLIGVGLFIAGWLVAKFVSWLIYRLLCKTDLDNKLAKKLGVTMLLEETGGKRQPEALERGVASIVFWLLMMLVVVGVLEFAGLKQAAEPIQRLVDTVIQSLPHIGKAVLILLVAYFAGMILRLFVRKAVDLFGIDRRFAELERQAEGEEAAAADKSLVAKPFSETSGQVVFWLVMVFGLAGALDALEVDALSVPLSNAIDQVIALVPLIGTAALIGVAGYVLSKIARTIVSNMLESVGFDRVVAKLNLSGLFGTSTPSKVAGWMVMAFVLVQTAIAAVSKLGLQTLSGPLTGMMERFWTMLPSAVVSVVFVVVGVFIGRLLRSIVRTALEGVGFDRLMDRIGFGQIATREDDLGKPSGVVGFVVQVTVILLALVQALQNLGLGTWSGYVDAFLQFAVTRAAVALIVVGVGFAVGNYVRDLIRARAASDVDTQPVWLAEFARSAVLVFAFTAAIHQIGVAEDFVLLAFALLFGGLCLAAALAFGLGSREVAGEIVRDRYNKAKKGPAPGGAKPPLAAPSSSSASSSGIFGKPPGQ